MKLMKGIRTSIKENRFPNFIQEFLDKLYPDGDVPSWVCDALEAVNISIEKKDVP